LKQKPVSNVFTLRTSHERTTRLRASYCTGRGTSWTVINFYNTTFV